MLTIVRTELSDNQSENACTSGVSADGAETDFAAVSTTFWIFEARHVVSLSLLSGATYFKCVDTISHTIYHSIYLDRVMVQ